MSKIILLLLLLLAGIVTTTKATAQKEEIEQLLLNVEKLAQFKQILADLKTGYQVISQGYDGIKNLSQGNFNLHKTFMDGLLQVSPTVRKYKKIGDIISYQIVLVKEYKSALNKFKKDKNFSIEELNYLGRVYNNLFKQSIRNLDELANIITANKLRMSDDERLKAIDEICDDMQDKLMFLRHFNNNTSILAIQRARESNDAATMQKVYGLNK